MGKERLSVSYKKLGGMRTDKPLTDFDAHESVDARNARTSTTGRITRRLGGIKYNTTQYSGAGNILGGFDFHYSTSSSKQIVAENTIIYTDDGTTQATIKTGQTAGKYYSFDTFQGYCIICNGTDTPLKYDGTTVSNLSISPPSVGSFAISGQTTGGALTLLATYKFLVTLYDNATGIESNPFTLSSAPSITLTGSNNAITGITGIPTSTGKYRRIYRTSGSGSVYYAQLAYTLADDSTTTINAGAGLTALNVADTALGAMINLSYDPSPIFQKVIIHNNKAIGFKANDSYLYISRENQPWYFPQAITDLSLGAPNYTIPVSVGDGDFITNIVKFYDYVIVFKKSSIHILSGYGELLPDNTLNFTLKQIEFMHFVGCVGFRAAKVVENFCYFIDYKGLYRTNGQIIEYIGKPMQGFFDQVSSTTFYKVNPSYMYNAIAELDNQKPLNCLRFSMPQGSSTINDFCIVFNYSDNQWTYDTGYSTQSMWLKRTSGVDYLLRGDDYGYVWVDNFQDGDGSLIFSTSTGYGNRNIDWFDASMSWSINSLIGGSILITLGTGAGQFRYIGANTADTLYVTVPWDVIPDSTSVAIVNKTGVYTGASTCDSASIASTLNDTSQSMTTNLYKGCYLEILSGKGSGQRYRITANNSNSFTINGVWTVTPDETSVYTIGGIDFFYLHKWDDLGDPSKTKRLQFVRPRLENLGEAVLDVYYLYDMQAATSSSLDSISVSSGALWDSGVWDVSLWDSNSIMQELQRPLVSEIHNFNSFAIGYKPSGLNIALDGLDKIYQIKGFGIR